MFFRCQLVSFRLALLSAGVIVLPACSKHVDDATPPPAVIVEHGQYRVPADSPLRKQLQIAAVSARAAPHMLSLPAMVEADPAHSYNVLPPLTGKLLELKVGLGDKVHRGQLLAVLDSGDLAQAYADVAKAQDAHALAEKQLTRAQAVQAAGGNARKDLENAQSNATQAAIELQRAQTRLAAVGGNPGAAVAHPLQITAPADGYVTTLNAAAGSFINDATASLMTIASLDPIWITAQAPESVAGQIAAGQAVTAQLVAYPDQPFSGTVSFVSPLLDPTTRRDAVRVQFANADARLKPNMFATVQIAVPQPAQVLVPQSALLMNNDSIDVFVEVSPWVFEKRPVQLGADDGNDSRVLSGVRSGERVIVKGGVLLND